MKFEYLILYTPESTKYCVFPEKTPKLSSNIHVQYLLIVTNWFTGTNFFLKLEIANMINTLTEWEIKKWKVCWILLNAHLQNMVTNINVNEPREGLVHIWIICTAGDGSTRGLHHTVSLLLQIVGQTRHVTGRLWNKHTWQVYNWFLNWS